MNPMNASNTIKQIVEVSSLLNSGATPFEIDAMLVKYMASVQKRLPRSYRFEAKAGTNVADGANAKAFAKLAQFGVTDEIRGALWCRAL
jgi:hypothetical protein